MSTDVRPKFNQGLFIALCGAFHRMWVLGFAFDTNSKNKPFAVFDSVAVAKKDFYTDLTAGEKATCDSGLDYSCYKCATDRCNNLGRPDHTCLVCNSTTDANCLEDPTLIQRVRCEAPATTDVSCFVNVGVSTRREELRWSSHVTKLLGMVLLSITGGSLHQLSSTKINFIWEHALIVLFSEHRNNSRLCDNSSSAFGLLIESGRLFDVCSDQGWRLQLLWISGGTKEMRPMLRAIGMSRPECDQPLSGCEILRSAEGRMHFN